MPHHATPTPRRSWPTSIRSPTQNAAKNPKRDPVSSARLPFTAHGVVNASADGAKQPRHGVPAPPLIAWYAEYSAPKLNCMHRAGGQSLKHQRGPAITRLQSKKQRARFLYVSFNPTVKGRFNGDGGWMIGPADEGQGIRQPAHRCAINGRFVHFLLLWACVCSGLGKPH